MMIRNFLRCRGCGNAFIARIAAGSTEATKFYIPCPHCHVPIRARATGDDFDSHKLQFRCDVLHSADVPEGSPVVTINPYVPARYDSDFDGPIGAFSAITLSQLLGENLMEYFQAEGQAQATIDERWEMIQHLYEYYLSEDWTNFDRVGSEGIGDWPVVETVRERTTLANQAFGRFGTLIVGTQSDHAELFFGSFSRKHQAAITRATYVDRLRNDSDAGTLAALQRSLFDILGLFVSRIEMWQTGRLLRWVDPPTLFDDLTLFRDEFPEMRDLYQQAFETASKTLRYPIAAQNTVKRNSPDDFGAIHPDAGIVPLKLRPSDLKEFDRLSNAHKAAYVALVPQWVSFAGVLENKVRNTIGHASARHDLRTGRIVSDADPTGLSYLEFLAKVFDMFELLCISLQLVSTARVASSPDF